MKRIGLLGGMSWESSIEYYRAVNEIARDRLGGLHCADEVLVPAEADRRIVRDESREQFDTTRLHAERAVEPALS